MIDLLTGFGLQLSIGICLIGLLVRGVIYIRGLNWQLDRVAYTAHPKAGFKGAIRSIFFWLLPFATRGWRVQPGMTLLFFVFHIGIIGIFLFLSAHTIIFQKTFGISLAVLPALAADVLAWGAVISAFFLAVRRMVMPEVRIMTTASDYMILMLSAAPLVTGLICRYEPAGYSFWLIAHMLSGEILLIAIPFTRLSHILLFFLSRAQLGMDFGIKRGGMKGKGMAW
jgi:nitrate reductase gamma subunit